MPSSDFPNIGWAGPIYCYVKSAGSFDCPDDQTAPQRRVVNGCTYTLQPMSYAINAAVHWTPDLGMGIGGAISQLTSPGKTVLLYEVTASPNPSASDPCSYNVADLSTPSEAGGAFNGTDKCVSPHGDGVYAYNADGPQPIQQATGYTGGAQQSSFIASINFAGRDGRHSRGASYLLCDGHVKWLRGDAVSTGDYYSADAASSGAPSFMATTPNTTEDEFAYTAPQAAGTQVPGWAVTFSPV